MTFKPDFPTPDGMDVIDALRGRGRTGRTTRGLMDSTGLDADQLASELKTLCEQEYVTQFKKGHYRLTPQAPYTWTTAT